MKTEKDLPGPKRATYLKALSALEMKNPGIVVQLLQPIVLEEPEFLVGRRLLREAQIMRSRGKSSFLGISGGGFSLGRSKVKKLLESGNWKEAISAAEKALDADPLGMASNKDLFAAAEMAASKVRETLPALQAAVEGAADDAAKSAAQRQLDLAREQTSSFEALARFALETIALEPKNEKEAKHELGNYLLGIKEFDEAFKVFEGIVQKTPNDLDAREKLKEAAARRSMNRSGLEQASFGDLVKKRQAGGAAEDVVVAVESAEELAQTVYEAHQAGTPDQEAARKLADLYFNSEDYAKALEYYRYLSALANETDPGLLRKISDIKLRIVLKNIEDKESQIESLGPDNPAAAQAQADLGQLRREHAELTLGEARRRVERNPTDLQYRFELGEQLVLAGHYKEAIPELQKARSNPNTRTRALNLLGRCYTERNMLDLAAKTLADAAEEIAGMDGTKKDILYNLGLVYERMGEKQKSLDCMKQIYEVDYDFLDVAERVESSYTS